MTPSTPLETPLEEATARLIDTAASLAAAISLLERGGKKAAASNKMFAVMLSDYRASLERTRAYLTALEASPSPGVGWTTIRLQRREDGGLRVFSDDVPGLILAGRDPRAIMDCVWPALAALEAPVAAPLPPPVQGGE